ncbi:hypothetical protein [Hymenobacter cavernae]|uniref:hypothetical protein n=1 Tax=Hymenobacter cavernae TaxID=2044852 RepID=UPI00166F6366|nr:hypothetical protein [Hymenobacter cavernae]
MEGVPLFEPSSLEGQTLNISGLRDGLGLAPFHGSVLSKKGAPTVPSGRGHTSAAPQWAALPYLLLFGLLIAAGDKVTLRTLLAINGIN